MAKAFYFHNHIYKAIKDHFPKSALAIYLNQYEIPNKTLVLLELRKIISGEELLYDSQDDKERAERCETELLNLKIEEVDIDEITILDFENPEDDIYADIKCKRIKIYLRGYPSLKWQQFFRISFTTNLDYAPPIDYDFRNNYLTLFTYNDKSDMVFIKPYITALVKWTNGKFH